MFMRTMSLICLTVVLGAGLARGDEFHITAAEKAACTGDAERLCFAAYPDEQKLLICMRDNLQALSPGCSKVFTAGLKRRGLLR